MAALLGSGRSTVCGCLCMSDCDGSALPWPRYNDNEGMGQARQYESQRAALAVGHDGAVVAAQVAESRGARAHSSLAGVAAARRQCAGHVGNGRVRPYAVAHDPVQRRSHDWVRR